jgi:GAF domain-containing protein
VDDPARSEPALRSENRQRLLTWATIAGVIALGTAASLFAVATQREHARDVDERAATEAAVAIQSRLDRSTSALSGAGALAADGEVTEEEFATFAAGVLPASGLITLAREVVVPGDRRAEFEANTGIAVVDSDGQGGLVPAETRDEHVVVVDLESSADEPTTVLGFDVAGDPARAEALSQAMTTGRAAWTGRVELAGSGDTGYFVVSPLHTASGDAIGFVSSAVPADDLLAEAARHLPPDTRLALDDGSGSVGDELTGGDQAEIELDGSSWTVAADDPDGANYMLAGLIALSTVLFALALVVVAVRDDRTARDNRALSGRLKVKNARNLALADLARELSAMDRLDAVFAAITAHAGGVLRADHADVGLLRGGEVVLSRSASDGSVRTTMQGLADRALGSGDLVIDENLPAAASGVGVPLVASNRIVLGVLVMVWQQGVEFNEPMMLTMRTLGELCAQTIERAILADRNAARAAQSHAIAEMGQRLGALSRRDDVVGLVADQARNVVRAASTNVAFLEPGRAGLRVAHDRTMDPELAERYSFQPLDARLPLVTAAIEAREVLLPSREVFTEQYPHLIGDLDAAGLQAVACLPLTDELGGPLGALGFAFADPNPFDEVDLDSMRTIAALVGSNLERAAATERRTRQAEALQGLSEELAAAVTRPQIGEVVTRLVPEVVEAGVAFLGFHDAATDALDVFAFAGISAELTEKYESVPLSMSTPGTRAFSTNSTVVLADHDALVAAYPDLAEDMDKANVRAAIACPVRGAGGQPLGVLSIGWPAQIAADARLRAVVATICDLVGATAERAGLYEVEHGLVLALQQRLIGTLPEVDGVDIAARYDPASDIVGIGGDWYDAVALDDGSLVVIVGDVTGHGVEAVTAMAELQSLITGLVRSGTPLGGIFSLASTMLAAGGPCCATAQLLHVDARQRRLGYLNAGHPWALLRRPDGSIARLDEAGHEPIGLPITPRPLHYVELQPGSMLLAYTDGLVERRQRAITDGIDLLGRHLARIDPGRPVAELLDELVAEARRANNGSVPEDDDVAAVLLRVRADG